MPLNWNFLEDIHISPRWANEEIQSTGLNLVVRNVYNEIKGLTCFYTFPS